MWNLTSVPDWIWAGGAIVSYVLLLWVHPMREVFARGLQIVRRYQHMPVTFGFVLMLHSLWLWSRKQSFVPIVDSHGFPSLSETTTYALTGMVEGALRPLFAFVHAPPVSFACFAVVAANLFGILRELRNGCEASLQPKTTLWILLILGLSGLAHICHVLGLSSWLHWNPFFLQQAGALFEGFVVFYCQAYILLFAALALVTLRRNLKKREILRVTARRCCRLFPYMIGYALVAPVAQRVLPEESTVRLVLLAILLAAVFLFGFLQLELLGEKKFSGWRSAMAHSLDLQRRHCGWTIWFLFICMAHWLVFHLFSTWIVSGLQESVITAQIACAAFAFLQGAISVWFIAVWAVLYQEKLAH